MGSYLLELFSLERSEAVYQLCLDAKGKLLACKRLGEGSVSAVTVDIRKIVQNPSGPGRTTISSSQTRTSSPSPNPDTSRDRPSLRF